MVTAERIPSVDPWGWRPPLRPIGIGGGGGGGGGDVVVEGNDGEDEKEDESGKEFRT